MSARRVLARAGAALYGAAWELRRRMYASGAWRTERVAARVVSVGNLTVGGTGKTTLALHLGAVLAARQVDFAIVCRRYRPGPGGRGDEELLFERAFGAARVYAGANKRELAARAAADGRRVVLVDDGFSHWPLERDVNLVLLDARDPWGGGALLPLGRLREPLRALQRADVLVLSHLDAQEDPAAALGRIGRRAPAAGRAAGRHRVTGVHAMAGAAAGAGERVWLVTATGNPAAVERGARAAGLDVAGVSRYRDHHWFTGPEVRAERARARAAGARLLLTPKDAVRWPAAGGDGALVIEVAWEWVCGGAEVERRVADA